MGQLRRGAALGLLGNVVLGRGDGERGRGGPLAATGCGAPAAPPPARPRLWGRPGRGARVFLRAGRGAAGRPPEGSRTRKSAGGAPRCAPPHTEVIRPRYQLALHVLYGFLVVLLRNELTASFVGRAPGLRPLPSGVDLSSEKVQPICTLLSLLPFSLGSSDLLPPRFSLNRNSDHLCLLFGFVDASSEKVLR